MDPSCDVLCVAQCMDLSFSNETLDTLWTCLTFLCNVKVEDHQRTSFLNYLTTNFSTVINTGIYSNCTKVEYAHLLNTVMGYAVPVEGYISPVIILLSIINNIFVCIVLLKPHMRSPVNVILVLIALSDTLTGVFPLLVYIYFYATERVHEWIPYNWCYAIYVFEHAIPVLFHTASVWLTLMLAIQRYICVCHPFKARTLCTMRNVIYGFCAIYLFATIVEIMWFFNKLFIETRRRSRLNPSVMVSACVISWHPWLEDSYRIYGNIYLGFRVIFINLIPCVSLIVLNTLLIYTMRKAMTRRFELLRQNMKSESHQLKETNSTTMMLVTVVVFVLIAEVPMAVFITLFMFEQMLEIIIFSIETVEVRFL